MKGPEYKSLHDLAQRVDLRLCNKRVFEALIAAGALDQVGGHRAQMLASVETTLFHGDSIRSRSIELRSG